MPSSLLGIRCPLCLHNTSFYHQDKKRRYVQCTLCHLVLADPEQRLSPEQEKQEYDLHENNIEDSGYHRFLSRIVPPIVDLIGTDKSLLDFGCGPAPALAEQFKERGYSVSLYDVFYHHSPETLEQTYDAITLTEVIEHLHNPRQVIDQLCQILKPGGVLAIMTQRVISLERFKQWQYKNDPTHVCFFHEESFTWLASYLSAQALTFYDRDIVLITKPD